MRRILPVYNPLNRHTFHHVYIAFDLKFYSVNMASRL